MKLVGLRMFDKNSPVHPSCLAITFAFALHSQFDFMALTSGWLISSQCSSLLIISYN